MENQTNKIKCPKCGFEINVNDILYSQVSQELKKEYNNKLTEEKRENHLAIE